MLSTSNAQNVQITRWVLIAFGVIVLSVALWLVHDILMLTLSAIIFAILLTSPVRFFVRTGMKRPFAVVLTFVLVLATVIVVVALLLPSLLDQFGTLLVAIQQSITSLQNQLQNPDTLRQNYPILNYPFLKDIDWQSIANQIRTQLPSSLTSLSPLVGGVANTVGSLASTVLSLLIVLFLSLYFVADPDTHVNGIVTLAPIPTRSRMREILAAVDLTLRKYLQGQIILMLFSGLSTGIMLFLFGIPLSVVLGVIAGLFAFVPTFGPILTLVPILAVSLSSPNVSPGATLAIVLIFFLLQFVQSQIVTPILMGQEVNLPPAIILLSQIIAGVFFGFMGLLLSVPLAAILVVLVREIYVKDVLGDVPKTETSTEIGIAPAVNSRTTGR